MSAIGFSVRPATADDEPVLRAVFAAARELELSMLPDDPAFRAQFIGQQYAAQRAGYGATFPDAERNVIVDGRDVVGVVETDRTGGRWRLIDIAILPALRGSGIGSAVVRDLLEDATAAGCPVDLEVLPWSPALRLYERLGFAFTGGDAARATMSWAPSAPVSRT